MFRNLNSQSDPARERVIAEARSWKGTPYHLGSCIKGVGVDCAQFVAAVFKSAGIVPADEILGTYGHNWYSSAKKERYLLGVMRHARKIAEGRAVRSMPDALPGDIVLVKTGSTRVFNHAGIVIAWPRVIHAINPCVSEVDASVHPMWSFHPVVVLDPWTE